MTVRRLLFCLTLLCLSAAPALAATTELISVNIVGDSGSGASRGPSISADGRFAAFRSAASDLVAGDTNGLSDIFVRDRLWGTTELASVSTTGDQANENSYWPSVSADGRFVAFDSYATNLVADDVNGVSDVFIRDRLTGTTELVSQGSAGERGSAGSTYPSISGDGRFVVFASAASNLVPGDTNGVADIFMHDRETDTTERLSISSVGEEADGPSNSATISADGRFVVFWAKAANLVASDTNGQMDVLVRDRAMGRTERVSVSSAEEEANGMSAGGSISSDGRFVEFISEASNLVPGDTNGERDVFIRDRQAGTTERASVSHSGEQADGPSWCSWISADGRFVVFRSSAANLVPEDTQLGGDIFVRDLVADTTELISVNSQGEPANGESLRTAISADGRIVAFESEASNLVTGDTNRHADIFLRDRGPQYLFFDVLEDHWAYQEIKACVDARVVSGYRDRYYRPESPVTRDQMAAFISRALAGTDANVPNGPPRARATFEDVPADHWAYRYVEYCVANNIVEGLTPTTYGPTISVSRDQMAVFIARAVAGGDGNVPDGPDAATFDDVPTDHWAHKYVEYCSAEGIVHGYDPVTYGPTIIVSRDQIAVFISRAFNLQL